MGLRLWLAAVAAGTLLVGLAPMGAVAATTPPLPTSIAAVGDSITQAASSGGSLGTDYPQNSWSTGTNSTVDSHYVRLLALNPAIGGHAYNRSVSGAKMADLAGQMAGVASLQPDYLTVLIGGNDLCTDTVAQMTSVADFRGQFTSAMDAFTAGSPGTNIYVVSIPNVYQLWQLFHSSFWARTIWSLGGICQSLLANPTSTRTADVQRRAEVAQRNIDFNAQLEQVCAQYAQCRFDGDALYDTAFTTADVAGDYFHPSITGQAKLAAVSWAAGYWPNGGPITDTPPTAAFTADCSGLACSFGGSTSTDDHGIVSYAWTFGDGGTATGVTASHAYASAGTYPVTLTVTDTIGQTATARQDVTVTAASGGPTVHVSDLSATSETRKGGWTATVTVWAADDSGNPVSGATVSGTWSTGASGSCTTGTSGSCWFTTNMNKKTGSATYTVLDVTRSGYTYDPSLNFPNTATVTVTAPPVR